MPTPIRWACPTELTADEARVAQALHRIGKFYVFLREIRGELFDEAFQAELAAVYQPRGTAPVPLPPLPDGLRALAEGEGELAGAGRLLE